MKRKLVILLLLFSSVALATKKKPCGEQPFPTDQLTQAEQEAAIAAVVKDPEVAPFVEDGLINTICAGFDFVGLEEPQKSKVLKFIKGGKCPKREARVTFWKNEEDEYWEYIVRLTHCGSSVTGEIKCKNLIPNARPSWTCLDEDVAVNAIMQNQEFLDALEQRGVKVPEELPFISLDISVDGRLNTSKLADPCDLCQCQEQDIESRNCECMGPSCVLQDIPCPERPHSFVATAYWNGTPDKTGCNQPDGCSVSYYIQPISGITVYYDRRKCQNDGLDGIITVINDKNDITPIQKDNNNWNRKPRGGQKPLAMSMPKGVSYTAKGPLIDGTGNSAHVCWQGWDLRFGIDPKIGIVLNQISFKDRTSNKSKYDRTPVQRSVLYRAHIDEILTGYGSPCFPVKGRNFLDYREYPASEFMGPIELGVDVPPYAQLLSPWFTFVDGSQFQLDDAVAIYERDGGVLWRKTDFPCEGPSCPDGTVTQRGRRGRELVIASAHTIGNYDYPLFWIFKQDGSIELEILATGCMECEGSRCKKTNKNIKFGTLVSKFVTAPNHWHIFAARLDFDIDGTKNRVYEKTIQLAPLDAKGNCAGEEVTNSCGNGFDEEETLLKTEQKAVRDLDSQLGMTWLVENEHSKNRLGHSRAYEVRLKPMAWPVVSPISRIGQRASFTQHNLFVTKYNDDELTAMGKYPVEQRKDQGLADYIQDDECIVDKDVVLWLSSGHAHVPHTEEYPVMPNESMGFCIRPHNFFSENPALDIDENGLVSC